MYKNFQELGIPQHDDDEKQLAKEIRATLTEQERNSTINPFKDNQDDALANWLEPIEGLQAPLTGSSDVGDVSWIVPTAQCTTACFVLGSPLHSWQWVTLGSTSIAHKGMLHAGKVIAATAVEVLQNPELIEKAKTELKERLQGKSYISPIPQNVKPLVKR
jgi:aminobenzoyl-glutamate utilization protein B